MTDADTAVAPFWTAGHGVAIHVRPIETSDEPAMILFHRSLTDRSVYSRYFSGTKLSTRISHERLKHTCNPDLLTDTVLIAEAGRAIGPPSIIAVARLCHRVAGGDAEAALLITDIAQGGGIGTELFRRLMPAARRRRAGRLIALVMSNNLSMRYMCVHFRMNVVDGDCNESTATLELGSR